MLIMRQASMNFGRVRFGQMKIDLKLKFELKGWTNSQCLTNEECLVIAQRSTICSSKYMRKIEFKAEARSADDLQILDNIQQNRLDLCSSVASLLLSALSQATTACKKLFNQVSYISSCLWHFRTKICLKHFIINLYCLN